MQRTVRRPPPQARATRIGNCSERPPSIICTRILTPGSRFRASQARSAANCRSRCQRAPSVRSRPRGSDRKRNRPPPARSALAYADPPDFRPRRPAATTRAAQLPRASAPGAARSRAAVAASAAVFRKALPQGLCHVSRDCSATGQVLDVMGQARAGLINGTQIADLFEFPARAVSPHGTRPPIASANENARPAQDSGDSA